MNSQDPRTWVKIGVMAHGELPGGSFVVPDGICIVFLTQPGDVCLDPFPQQLALSERMLNDLLLQEAKIDDTRIFSIVYRPGDVCPQLRLTFMYDGLPEGIWRLPLPRAFPQSGTFGKRPVEFKTALWTIDNARKRFPDAYDKNDLEYEKGIHLERIVREVVPELTMGRNTVVYVTSCRYTDDPRIFAEAKKLNAKVSRIPVNLVNYKKTSNQVTTRWQVRATVKGNPFIYGSTLRNLREGHEYGPSSSVQAAMINKIDAMNRRNRRKALMLDA